MTELSATDRSTVVSYLKKSRLFGGFPEEYLSILADMSEMMTMKQDTVVLKEGNPNDCLYLLLDGALSVNLAGKQIIKLKRRGDLVGEMSLINKKPCSATVEAESSSKILKLDGRLIDQPKILEDSMSTGILYRVFSIILSDKLVLTSAKARDFEIANKTLNDHQIKLQDAYQNSLSEIEKRTAIEMELRRYQDHLEEMVGERTADAKQAQVHAENANQAKSDFLTNISHELRTPLQAVLNFALMGSSRIDSLSRDKLVQYFDNINTAGTRLLSLVDDLLDLAKLEAGKMIFEIGKSTLTNLVNEVLSEFGALLEQRSLKIAFSKPEKEEYLMVDQIKIMQVIRNLVANAVKFSEPNDTITIDIKHHQEFSQLKIIDQGIGIPPDELETVFEKFCQSRRSKTGAGGTGLGLAICKEIVSTHQGEIWAENNPGTGSTFIFTLPRNKTLSCPLTAVEDQ